MSNNLNDIVLLVGTGYMGKEYAKVLKAQGRNFVAVGRGEASADEFERSTGVAVVRGGIENYLAHKIDNKLPNRVIVAVSEVEEEKVTIALLRHGIKNLLIEKPGAQDFDALTRLKREADISGANVYIAYNRRFYASALAARHLIEDDGGVKSFNFEFTETQSLVNEFVKAKQEENLFFANSTHVLDLAFYLSGKPKIISCYRKGLAFCGAGICDNDAIFSYQANWDAPGRWSVEVLTRTKRFIFRPMEKLQIQLIGSFDVSFADIEYKLDCGYKPGLYKETEAFLDNTSEAKMLCTIEEQAKNTEWYKKIYLGQKKE